MSYYPTPHHHAYSMIPYDYHEPQPVYQHHHHGIAYEGQKPAPVYYPSYHHHQQQQQHYNNNRHHHAPPPPAHNKGFNRRDSADSGISDWGGRKISNASTASSASFNEDINGGLEDIREENLPPFEEPDDELCEKIVQQVEFYFSDANITKDKFLLKHVRRNKEGFVSLKLISSFKRVKHLTKDWRQVAFAVAKSSSRLEVNDQKTKVRRKDDLPEYDETTPSRTVVALNLPMERPTIEAVAEIFSACGEITLIRVLRPGNPIPADIKPFSQKHPEVAASVCALVEFERTEFAMRALAKFNNGEDGMKVMELTSPPPTKKESEAGVRHKKTSLPASVNQQLFQRRMSHGVPFGAEARSRKMSLNPNMKFSNLPPLMMAAGEHNKEFPLNPNAPSFTNNHNKGNAAPMSSRPFIMAMEASAKSTSNSPPSRSAWMTKRMSLSGGGGLTLPPNVIRMPKGPEEGSKGFLTRRGFRKVSSSSTSSGSSSTSEQMESCERSR